MSKSPRKPKPSKQRREPDPQVVAHLTGQIAAIVCARLHDIVYEEASQEYLKLVDYFADTEHATLDPAHQEPAAAESASFAIGLALGARLGGVR